MPSGVTHNIITLAATALTTGAVALFIDNSGTLSTGIVLGGVAGLLVSPDQDVDAGNRSDTLIRAIFPPLEILWDVFWLPYRKLYSHRGISHMPIVGTLTRTLFYPLMWPVMAVLYLLLPGVALAGMFTQLCLVDSLHALADKLVSRARKEWN